MSKFKKAFGLNKTRIEEGRWIPHEGMEFLIASARKKAFADEFAELPRRFPGGMVKTRGAELALHKLVAEHLLLDWRGVDDDQGNPIPYSAQAAARLFEEEPLFVEFVIQTANKEAFFQTQAEEAQLGNSAPVSAGT